MLKWILALCVSLAAVPRSGAAQATVRVGAEQLEAPRPLNEQTRAAVIRDYLESWQSMRTALEQNRADLLDADFVGTARDRLGKTVQDQAALGITTRYHDQSHDIELLFYSPEGSSIELADTADYDVEVLKNGRLLATDPQHAHFIVVLTPSEVRWRVRIFQAGSN
jgi:hypothetical protein